MIPKQVLIINCPHCGYRRKYLPNKLTSTSYWSDKRTKCFKCGKSFIVGKNVVQDLFKNNKGTDFVNYKLK